MEYHDAHEPESKINTRTKELNKVSKEPTLEIDNEIKYNMNKIVHVDTDIITSDEIHIPIQDSETEEVINTENCNKIDEKSNIFMNSRYRANYILPVEFSVDENDGLAKSMERIESENKSCETQNKSNIVKNEIIASVNEFNNVLKEITDKENSKNVAVPMPNLSEPEYLLGSVNAVDKTYDEISFNTMFGNSETALPCLTFSETEKIIRNIYDDYNSIIQSDHDYAKLSPNNITQLSPTVNTLETGLINEEIDIIENSNEHDKELFKSFNETEFQMEFEMFLQTSKHDSYESKNEIRRPDETTENGDNIHFLDISDEVEIKLLSNEEDVEIISISSDKNDRTTRESNVDSDCEGYHSSDFEIIDEEEACLNGLMVNCNPKGKSNSDDSQKVINDRLNSDFSKYFDRPGPSNRNPFHTYNDVKLIEDQYRNDHVIPQDEDYVELFAQPWAMLHFEAENKAFHSTKKMNVEVDDVGFNVALLQRLHNENKTDMRYEPEANESAKKILSMYPRENRKRRRRF